MKRKINRKLLYLTYLMLILFSISGCGSQGTNTASDADSYGSFTIEKTYSFDEKYYAVCESVENAEGKNGDVKYIEISVYTADSEELVGTFCPARAMDFWGICWESSTYNIWIQSADVGIICYKYDNGQWVQDDSAERPNDIISKYD